jgi:hypothetical protein
MDTRMSPSTRALGAAGLLPLIGVVALLLAGPEAPVRAAALMIGHAYAALILSFLGGLWWGLAAAAGDRAPRWLWAAAVVPSLWAFAALGLAGLGRIGIEAALAITGAGLWLALLVDRALVAQRLAPPWWTALRLPLSLGLGGLALLAAALGR